MARKVGRREGAEGMRGESGIKKGGSSVSLIPRRMRGVGGLDGLFVNFERTITADRLEVEEQEKVDRGHGQWQEGVGLQRGAVTGLVGGDDGLLVGITFVAGLLGGFKFVTRDGGHRSEEEEQNGRLGLLRLLRGLGPLLPLRLPVQAVAVDHRRRSSSRLLPLQAFRDH